jgi:hypothetical protein
MNDHKEFCEYPSKNNILKTSYDILTIIIMKYVSNLSIKNLKLRMIIKSFVNTHPGMAFLKHLTKFLRSLLQNELNFLLK